MRCPERTVSTKDATDEELLAYLEDFQTRHKDRVWGTSNEELESFMAAYAELTRRGVREYAAETDRLYPRKSTKAKRTADKS
jgi:hypothetical protein